MATAEQREQLAAAVDWLTYAVHELPSGVLYGADAATPAECADLMAGLDEFAALCRGLGVADMDTFIAECRWHFEHYPHYLGRSRHFASYEQYIRQRRGPVRVAEPPRHFR